MSQLWAYRRLQSWDPWMLGCVTKAPKFDAQLKAYTPRLKLEMVWLRLYLFFLRLKLELAILRLRSHGSSLKRLV